MEDYKILTAGSSGELSEQVNEAMQIGYYPVGGVCRQHREWSQAVAKQ